MRSVMVHTEVWLAAFVCTRACMYHVRTRARTHANAHKHTHIHTRTHAHASTHTRAQHAAQAPQPSLGPVTLKWSPVPLRPFARVHTSAHFDSLGAPKLGGPETMTAPKLWRLLNYGGPEMMAATKDPLRETMQREADS